MIKSEEHPNDLVNEFTKIQSSYWEDGLLIGGHKECPIKLNNITLRIVPMSPICSNVCLPPQNPSWVHFRRVHEAALKLTYSISLTLHKTAPSLWQCAQNLTMTEHHPMTNTSRHQRIVNRCVKNRQEIDHFIVTYAQSHLHDYLSKWYLENLAELLW